MRFRETGLDGAWLIEPERRSDERGYFARTWCINEFDMHGIGMDFVQCSTSFNHARGTLRGIHLQLAPYQEAKLIRCTRGRAYDVMVDLRPESPSFGEWRAYELSADNGRLVYLPEGFGHAFQTVADDTELSYHISEFYQQTSSAGVRWNDPDLAIQWPDANNPVLSQRDQGLPSLREYANRHAAGTLPARRWAS